MIDKPLHVQVAEALGWSVKFMGSTWWGFPGPGMYVGELAVPNYDTDWSATGPLIEKYSIALLSREDYGPGNREPYRGRVWWALFEPHYGHDGEAYDDFEDAEDRPEHKTPLEAVCWLLLRMGKAGKL